MIKANELRVGNFVDHIPTNETACEVHTINRYGKELWLTDNPHGVKFDTSIEDIAPIELTEDWLKRFSIEKLHVSGYVIDGATYWKKGGIVFYEIKGKYYLPVGENITHGKTVIEFNKVHELQNIFALTGEELEIK